MVTKFILIFLHLVPNVGVEYKYFPVIFIDSLLVCENKYYLKIYLDNFAYKTVEIFLETDEDYLYLF